MSTQNAIANYAGEQLQELNHGRALAMRIIAEAKITDGYVAQRVIALCEEYLPTNARLRQIEQQRAGSVRVIEL